MVKITILKKGESKSNPGLNSKLVLSLAVDKVELLVYGYEARPATKKEYSSATKWDNIFMDLDFRSAYEQSPHVYVATFSDKRSTYIFKIWANLSLSNQALLLWKAGELQSLSAKHELAAIVTNIK
jgi:hypothetical protein